MPLRRRTHPRPPSRWWRAIAEAPTTPITAYLALIGVLGLVSGHGITPGPVHHVLPGWLIMAWTIGIAAGGLAATIGAITARTRIESGGLGFLAYGAALYGSVIGVVNWPGSGLAIAVSIAVLAMCLIRMRVLTLARRAQRRAGQIARKKERR